MYLTACCIFCIFCFCFLALLTYFSNHRNLTLFHWIRGKFLRFPRALLSPQEKGTWKKVVVAFSTGCMLSRAWHGFKVRRSSCAWQRLQVFPRLTPVTYVFPPLAPVASFPALGTGCMFSRAWHQLRVFPPFAIVGKVAISSYDCFSLLKLPSVYGM